MCPDDSYRNLPGFLQLTEPLEPEQLALQVALLTMELAEVRTRLALLADSMAQMGTVLRLPDGGLFINERSPNNGARRSRS
jgi:hypothetical protein